MRFNAAVSYEQPAGRFEIAQDDHGEYHVSDDLADRWRGARKAARELDRQVLRHILAAEPDHADTSGIALELCWMGEDPAWIWRTLGAGQRASLAAWVTGPDGMKRYDRAAYEAPEMVLLRATIGADSR